MSAGLDELGFDSAPVDRISVIATRLEVADSERVDPPVDLWDRIEAAVASEPKAGPRVPPGRNVPLGTLVEYQIDADDYIVAVGQSWEEFARDNDGADLAVNPPNRSLWTYFDREDTRGIWQLLVTHVRSSQKSVQVPLRCDAPETRRWTEMTLIPLPEGGVRFQSVVVFEEFRPTVELLDMQAGRDESSEPVLVCSWCGQGQHGSDWCDIEDLVRDTRLLEREKLPPVSYGICAGCRDEMSDELAGAGGISEAAS